MRAADRWGAQGWRLELVGGVAGSLLRSNWGLMALTERWWTLEASISKKICLWQLSAVCSYTAKGSQLLSPEVRLPRESDSPKGARVCVTFCLQQQLHLKHNWPDWWWRRWRSSYQLFAEEEGDTGLAAESPVNEILRNIILFLFFSGILTVVQPLNLHKNFRIRK